MKFITNTTTFIKLPSIIPLIIIFICGLNIFAQDKPPVDRDDFSSYNVVNWAYCDAALAHLDDVYSKADELDDKEKYLIIVIRLAKGERANLYESRRRSLDNFFKSKKLRYFITQGSLVKEVGRAEFYIGGKLYFGLGFKMNSRGFCIGPSIG